MRGLRSGIQLSGRKIKPITIDKPPPPGGEKEAYVRETKLLRMLKLSLLDDN